MSNDLIELIKAIPFFLALQLILLITTRLFKLRKTERVIVSASFIIRALFVFIMASVGFDPWINDTVKYDKYALLIAQGNTNFDASLSVISHVFIGGVIYNFFGHSIALWAMLNAFISALTVIILIKVVDILYGSSESKVSSFIYAISPSYVLLSALIQRETEIIFFIVLSIFYFIKYLDESKTKYLLIYISFIIIGGLFRPLNAPLFLAIAFPFILSQIYNSRLIQKSNVMKPFFLLFVLVVVPASIVGALFLSPLSDTIQHKLTEEALLGEAEYRIAGQSVYLQDIKYTSIWSIFYYMPIKFIYFTFGPFIWMARNISTFFAALEGLANFVFIILSWRGIKYLKLKNKSIAYFLLMFAFGSLSAYGVIDSNFGTALRHRISFTFIFVILAGYSLARSKGIFYLFSDIFNLRRQGVTRVLTLLFISSVLLFLPKSALAVEKDINKLPYEDDSVRIWSVNSLEKISSHYSISGTKSEFKDSIKINAAKNEYESFQVIITNKDDKALEINNIDVSDLKSSSKNSSLISKKNVEVFYVGYVNEKYPDVLFPANIDKYRNEFRGIAKGENFNLWIIIYVPPDMKASEYEGHVYLKANNKTYNIPILLKVWNFTLPRRTNVKTQLFTIHYKEIESRYKKDVFSEEYERFIKNIFEEYKKHRISPGYATPVPLNLLYKSKKYDSEYIAKYFEKWCKYWTDTGLDCNRIQMPETIDDIEKYSGSIYKIIKRNGWLDRVYIKLPYDEAIKGKNVDENMKWAKAIRKIMPDIKIYHTFDGLKRGLTKDILNTYSGYVDIWSLENNAYFKNSDIRSFINKRVQQGENMSWYIHGRMMVWKPLEDLRYSFWEMWANDVSMVSLWRTNFWSKPQQKSVVGKEVRMPEKNTWREKKGIGTTNTREGIGNGTLFWPDDDRVLNSIRLEVIRDGIEDYEYFIIAKKSNINIDTLKARENILKQRENLAYQIENIPKK